MKNRLQAGAHPGTNNGCIAHVSIATAHQSLETDHHVVADRKWCIPTLLGVLYHTPGKERINSLWTREVSNL